MNKLYSGNPIIHIRGDSFYYISLCGGPVIRGQMTAGSPETATCQDCLDKYHSVKQAVMEKNNIPLSFDEKMINWSNFGGGEYGALSWLAVAIMTLGLGLPIAFLMKMLGKAYVKIKKLE